MRLRILALCVALLLPQVVSGGQARRESLVAAGTTISTAGGAVVVNTTSLGNDSAILYVRTASEVATASLAVTVHGAATDGQAVTLCTLTAITTEVNNFWWIGPGAVATEAGIDGACDVPLTRNISFIFTVTGAGASFDVTSELLAVAQ